MTLVLSQPWRSYPILAVDLETTGKDPLTCEPTEISCVRFEGGNIAGRFTTLLKPSIPIPEEAKEKTGITDEMVKDAPTLGEVALHELVKLSEGAIPLAFNRRYDRTVMHRYLSGEGVTLFDPLVPWLCSSAMAWSADRFEPGSGRHKLTACCERRGIRIVGAHRAEADAIAAGMLFYALMGGADKATMQQLLARVDKIEDERERDYAAFRRRVTEPERLAWRQYACAFTASAYASTSERHDDAADFANRMLEIERERFK